MVENTSAINASTASAMGSGGEAISLDRLARDASALLTEINRTSGTRSSEMAETMDSASLQRVAQDADSLLADINGASELPRVMRNISQMITDGEQLCSRVTDGAPSREQADVQAAILLGSRGFNLPKLSYCIDNLSTAQTFGPLEAIQPTDIDGFLRNERQNCLLALIADTAKSTQEQVDDFVIAAQQDRWEEEKRKVLSSIEVSADASTEHRLQSLNGSLSLNTSSFMRSRDTMLTAAGTPVRARLSPEELKYARALAEHNAEMLAGAALLGNDSHSLVDKMANVAEQLELKDVTLLWQLLQAMQSRALEAKKGREPLAFAAKRFLETKHLKDLRATVYGNLNRAALGGVPGTAQLIRAYLNVKPVMPATQDEPMVGGHPVWVVLYHALRCGDLACAREVALQAGLADLAGKFQECQRNPQGRLGERSTAEVRLEYMRELGPGLATGSQYRRVVLAVLAGCDVTNKHGEVGSTHVEDYLWIKLCKVFHAPPAIPAQSADSLPLTKLQSIVAEEYDESHSDSKQRPLQFAYVLLLTAQFEMAIEFLYRVDIHKCHAVHMAIALNQLDLLNDTPEYFDPLMVKEQDRCMLNLPRLITSYTRSFEMSEPELALEYYYALKERHEHFWLQCVTELILETKTFARILGQRNADGGTVRGALDKFLCVGSAGFAARNRVASAVAEAAESRGLNEEAVALYELADDREKCVQLLTKVLSAQVTQAGPEGSKRAKLQKIAQQTMNRYQSPCLNLLMDLMSFFDLYHESKNNEAIELVRRLRLIPLDMNEVDVMVTTFCSLPEQVRRVIPDVLVALMTILAEQYKAIKRPTHRTSLSLIPLLGGGFEAKLDVIRKQANAIIKYAGLVPYRLPANVNARLVQMEANMA